MTDRGREWWKTGVIYQIYPRSFQDSDGDGVGDLAGIESRLDHLVDLGVDAVWISPFYPSPMADFGYDVSDYTGVDPLFGTLEDFERLIAAIHARGLKLLLDFVPSHSSDQHPWFQASRSARDDPKRDWYVWRDPAPDGGPPTNWIAEFGGSTWDWDDATEQYYLHSFLPEQPTINWRNPAARAAMLDAIRTWFDRGVDGFRVDAIEHAAPDPEKGDNPVDPDWDGGGGPARAHLGAASKHQPEVFRVVDEMRRLAERYDPPRLLVGEAYGRLEEVVRYYGAEGLHGFQLPFNFLLIGAEWDPRVIAGLVEAYEAALPEGAWPNWVLGNHDRHRIASRAGRAQAGVAATLLLTLRGTPTIYQGDELGMENVEIPPDRVQDPWEKRVPGQGLNRDQVRTPLAWDGTAHGGFTTGAPWLPMDLRPAVTVEAQRGDPASMLNLHRRLLRLRRAEPALTLGDYRTISVDDASFRFARSHGSRRIGVALNLSDRPRPVDLNGATLLSTTGDDALTGDLAPNEGRVVALD
ncbi:alpha-amylase family glycosyl hydrolase [Jannaschia ovalis]|uniref:Alpha-amylase family glycosyl hydrolase n=1 Tax=Jannaschia ovalis TaxID=3038773 RepID=A0ABY8LD51_9RHOB|nr:alpha-amylase family glycosyl hydrolase [Jannaschia sp. GRR-S6-38]WGH79237.1 alpha-amylase family glycosyl hydrolase [Jannaschia sp. GRR-S6-38]